VVHLVCRELAVEGGDTAFRWDRDGSPLRPQTNRCTSVSREGQHGPVVDSREIYSKR